MSSSSFGHFTAAPTVAPSPAARRSMLVRSPSPSRSQSHSTTELDDITEAMNGNMTPTQDSTYMIKITSLPTTPYRRQTPVEELALHRLHAIQSYSGSLMRRSPMIRHQWRRYVFVLTHDAIHIFAARGPWFVMDVAEDETRREQSQSMTNGDRGYNSNATAATGVMNPAPVLDDDQPLMNDTPAMTVPLTAMLGTRPAVASMWGTCCFQLNMVDHVMFLRARSPTEREAWCRRINAACARSRWLSSVRTPTLSTAHHTSTTHSNIDPSDVTLFRLRTVTPRGTEHTVMRSGIEMRHFMETVEHFYSGTHPLPKAPVCSGNDTSMRRYLMHLREYFMELLAMPLDVLRRQVLQFLLQDQETYLPDSQAASSNKRDSFRSYSSLDDTATTDSQPSNEMITAYAISPQRRRADVEVGWAKTTPASDVPLTLTELMQPDRTRIAVMSIVASSSQQDTTAAMPVTDDHCNTLIRVFDAVTWCQSAPTADTGDLILDPKKSRSLAHGFLASQPQPGHVIHAEWCDRVLMTLVSESMTPPLQLDPQVEMRHMSPTAPLRGWGAEAVMTYLVVRLFHLTAGNAAVQAELMPWLHVKSHAWVLQQKTSVDSLNHLMHLTSRRHAVTGTNQVNNPTNLSQYWFAMMMEPWLVAVWHVGTRQLMRWCDLRRFEQQNTEVFKKTGVVPTSATQESHSLSHLTRQEPMVTLPVVRFHPDTSQPLLVVSSLQTGVVIWDYLGNQVKWHLHHPSTHFALCTVVDDSSSHLNASVIARRGAAGATTANNALSQPSLSAIPSSFQLAAVHLADNQFHAKVKVWSLQKETSTDLRRNKKLSIYEPGIWDGEEREYGIGTPVSTTTASTTELNETNNVHSLWRVLETPRIQFHPTRTNQLLIISEYGNCMIWHYDDQSNESGQVTSLSRFMEEAWRLEALDAMTPLMTPMVDESNNRVESNTAPEESSDLYEKALFDDKSGILQDNHRSNHHTSANPPPVCSIPDLDATTSRMNQLDARNYAENQSFILPILQWRVHAAQYTLDGRYVWTWTPGDGCLRLWSVERGQLVAQCLLSNDEVMHHSACHPQLLEENGTSRKLLVLSGAVLKCRSLREVLGTSGQGLPVYGSSNNNFVNNNVHSSIQSVNGHSSLSHSTPSLTASLTLSRASAGGLRFSETASKSSSLSNVNHVALGHGHALPASHSSSPIIYHTKQQEWDPRITCSEMLAHVTPRIRACHATCTLARVQFQLTQAIILREVNMVKRLLELHPTLDPNFVSVRHGQVPLTLAARLGVWRVVQLLMQRGANPNLRCSPSDDILPIHAACASCELRTLQQVLESSLVDVNAVWSGEMGGASAVSTTSDETGGLSLSAVSPYAIESPPRHITALHIAAFHGRADLIEALCRRGARVDVRDSNNRTPLHYACAMYRVHKDASCIEKLLMYGAPTHIVSISGSTVLHEAVFAEDPLRVVLMLLKAGLQAECQRDIYGDTPVDIHPAVFYKSKVQPYLRLDTLEMLKYQLRIMT